MTLSVGQKAPLFTLPVDNNQDVSLSDYIGKKVILYFYPKDDTPGCTLESCGFRDIYAELKNLNTEIIGISKDSVSSHHRFKEKYDLPFILLSDEKGAVCQEYDVIGEKQMFGKSYQGIIRSTFLIDETGIITALWRNLTVNGHVPAVIEAVKNGSKSV